MPRNRKCSDLEWYRDYNIGSGYISVQIANFVDAWGTVDDEGASVGFGSSNGLHTALMVGGAGRGNLNAVV